MKASPEWSVKNTFRSCQSPVTFGPHSADGTKKISPKAYPSFTWEIMDNEWGDLRPCMHDVASGFRFTFYCLYSFHAMIAYRGVSAWWNDPKRDADTKTCHAKYAKSHCGVLKRKGHHSTLGHKSGDHEFYLFQSLCCASRLGQKLWYDTDAGNVQKAYHHH